MVVKRKDFMAVLDEKWKSEVQKSDILCSKTGCYVIKDFIGEGLYGRVAKCVNVFTTQEVALKILKTRNSSANEREITMLKAVSVLDPVKANVVKFLETFEHKGQTCLAFEMLDKSLHQLVIESHRDPLSLSEIRPVAQQLLVALKALKGIGVVHSDLKSDNIMLTDHPTEPFKVKLIDFGMSFFISEKIRCSSIQPLGYRAPEVTLGLPVSEAIDMWGLGCVLFRMYRATHLFALHCKYQSMKDIVRTLGQPADHLLNAGFDSRKYFKVIEDSGRPAWCLKSRKEYQRDTLSKSQIRPRPFESLDDLITQDRKMQGSMELEDQRAFVRFLKSLLQTDPEKRITPEKALQNPFITMSHMMKEKHTSSYVKECVDKMLVCSVEESGKELLSDSKMSTDESGSTASPSMDEAAAPSAASAADRSPDEGSTVKVKKSYLKRIRQFFRK